MSKQRLAASDDKVSVLALAAICLVIYFVAASF
ncbi:MAG: hypothetical protein FD130_365 [Halothiobacillaceae bacterium]|nr:MAG: hypothetical protein FD130_365 [Halothiobacillaceae bacterium]